MRVDIDKLGGGKFSLRCKEAGKDGRTVYRTGPLSKDEVKAAFRAQAQSLLEAEARLRPDRPSTVG